MMMGGLSAEAEAERQQEQQNTLLCALNAVQTFDFSGRAVRLLYLVEGCAVSVVCLCEPDLISLLHGFFTVSS